MCETLDPLCEHLRVHVTSLFELLGVSEALDLKETLLTLYTANFFRSTKNFAKKYNLELTAATFLIVAHSDASMDIACEWQKCIGDTINLVSPLRCGNDNK